MRSIRMRGQSVRVAIRATTGRFSFRTTGRAATSLNVSRGCDMVQFSQESSPELKPRHVRVNSLLSILSGPATMPRAAEPTRKRILEAAYRLFRRQGYSRVTMDEISATARLTKRTLYHHFESKDRLLADVLAEQHELALRAFRTFGDKLSGSPEAIVAGMFRGLAGWADRPRGGGSGLPRLGIS